MSKSLILAFVTGAGICAWISAKVFDSLSSEPSDAQLHPRSFLPPYPDDKYHNIHWFIQISDLHISIFYDPDRIKQLEDFCETYIDIIQPEVVLVSGDLTDAKDKNFQGSRQYVWEWEQYQRILNSSGVVRKTVWLDTRGNHDAFAVPSLDDKLNYFRSYSVQGAAYPGSPYVYHHKLQDGTTYSFVAVDACPIPGPKRPFNFFGIMDESRMSELETLAEKSEGSNFTVWFGHYPTATVIGTEKPLAQFISEKGQVYMCGHLHTLGGLVKNMYAQHSSGALELELGDWKENRLFRVFAFDHDIFSFTDEVYDQWPIVLITNPKHVQFKMPKTEPVGKMLNSTHIRMLVFSPGKIEKVKVNIDGYDMGRATHVEGPLYVLPWKPRDFASGMHIIEVHVKDTLGNERTISQPFALDNSWTPFDIIRRFLLLSDHATSIFAVFLLEFFSFGALLCMVFLLKSRIKAALGNAWNNRIAALLYAPLIKLYLVVCHRKIFACIMLFQLYVAVGPWFVGEILDGEYGVMFAWGIIVQGQYILGSLTYLYAFCQLLLFNIPLTFYLGYCMELAQRRTTPSEQNHHHLKPWLRRARQVLLYLRHHLIFYFLVLFEAYLAYSGFFLAYGSLALALGPVRTFSIPFAFILRHMALKPGSVSATDLIVHNSHKAR